MGLSELQVERSLTNWDELVTPELEIVWIFAECKIWDIK